MNHTWITSLISDQVYDLNRTLLNPQSAKKILQEFGLNTTISGSIITLLDPVDGLNHQWLKTRHPNLHIATTCESTQKECTQENRSIVLTELHHQGKGRRGHQWMAPFAHNFTGSLKFHLQELSLRPEQLLMGIAVAVCEVLKPFIPEKCIGIKWPNDVWVNGRKIAGTLAEQDGDYWIIGLGVNLNTTHHQLQPNWTSLFNETQHRCNRSQLSHLLIQAVKKNLCQNTWLDLGIQSGYDITRGKRLETCDDPPIRGIGAGIQDDGSLSLVDDLDKTHRLTRQRIRIIHYES
jgi:biotin-[acetyl-CoA-carboxylase] ligase BirA-like protein